MGNIFSLFYNRKYTRYDTLDPLLIDDILEPDLKFLDNDNEEYEGNSTDMAPPAGEDPKGVGGNN